MPWQECDRVTERVEFLELLTGVTALVGAPASLTFDGFISRSLISEIRVDSVRQPFGL